MIARVLLVEDSPTDAELTREVFADVDLTLATDGEAALERLRDPGARFDLVLLDLNLPRLGGFDVLREIRADARLTGLPVIVLTTSRDPEDERRAGGGEADAFLSKPTDLPGFERLARHVRATWLARYTF